MHTPNTTSPATTDRQELIRQVLERSRKAALAEAGTQQRKVSEVKDLQRKELEKLLYGDAKGSDGEAAMGEDLSLEEDVMAEAEEGLEKEHEQRMKAVQAAPDAYVFKRTDATVGLQHDDDRRIGLADEVLQDPETAVRVTKHEAEHRKQETGNQQAELPETGDPEIDRLRTLNRIDFRERGAIDAEGGLKDHTPEYHGYVRTTNRIAAYLNDAGESGDRLVREAGRTTEGFRKVQVAMRTAAINSRLRKAASITAA